MRVQDKLRDSRRGEFETFLFDNSQPFLQADRTAVLKPSATLRLGKAVRRAFTLADPRLAETGTPAGTLLPIQPSFREAEQICTAAASCALTKPAASQADGQSTVAARQAAFTSPSSPFRGQSST
jgi:hypothetical protein